MDATTDLYICWLHDEPVPRSESIVLWGHGWSAAVCRSCGMEDGALDRLERLGLERAAATREGA